MKKIFSAIVTAGLLSAAAACTGVFEPDRREAGRRIPENAAVTLGFGVPTGLATKAGMAGSPSIESMHVLVFDAEGTLLHAKKAEAGAVNRPEQISWWKVEVMMAAEKRRIHFIANLPDALVPEYGSEQSIFQSLAVTHPAAAYWQCVELDRIDPYTYTGNKTYMYVRDDGTLSGEVPVPNAATAQADGSYIDNNGFTVSAGDYINRNGDKIVDGTGYYHVPSATSPLRNLLPLVRNFACIRFTNNWPDFTLRKIALVNTPRSGLVAPYDNANGIAEVYSGLVGQPFGTKPDIAASGGYTPILPADGIDTDFPAAFTTVSGNTAELYMYERGIPTADATCVLIGGELAGATSSQMDSQGNTWFKIEIAEENGSYFPVLRGFTYDMTLGSIEISATRYASAEAAYGASPVGDISNSTETSTLTQITDGQGLTLWVNTIDHPDLTGGRTVPLIYTFFYENMGTKTYFCEGASDKISFSRMRKPGSTLDWATEETVIPKGVINDTSNSEYLALVPNPDYIWYLAEVTLKARRDEILQSNIRVEGIVRASDVTGYAKRLHRDITYTVMGQQKLRLRTSGLAADASGNTTTVTLILPNTLGPAVFPLTFRIEAEDNNLTPTDNLTAETGKSAFNASKNTFCFLKTISYSEYLASADATLPYAFPCVFKTTKATGKNPVTRIRVTEKSERTSWFKGGDEATVPLAVGSASTNE